MILISGALPSIGEMLKESDEMCRLGAIQMIHELSRREANRPKIVSLGCLSHIVSMITEVYEGALVHLMQENAIRAAMHICQTESFQSEVLHAGVIDGITLQLRAGTNDAKEAAVQL